MLEPRAASQLTFLGLLACATGCGNVGPEARMDRKARDTDHVTTYEKYIEQLGALHTQLSKVDLASSKTVPCTAKSLREATGVQKIGSSYAASTAPYLERFATDGEWTEDTSPMAWMTDASWVKSFDQPLDETRRAPARRSRARCRETRKTLSSAAKRGANPKQPMAAPRRPATSCPPSTARGGILNGGERSFSSGLKLIDLGRSYKPPLDWGSFIVD